MYQHLSPDYQEKVVARWAKVLDSGETKIRSEAARVATALVLENTQREFDKQNQRLNEREGDTCHRSAASHRTACVRPSRFAR